MKPSQTVMIGSAVMQQCYRLELMFLLKLYSNAKLFAWVIKDVIGSNCYQTEHAKPGKGDVKLPRSPHFLELDRFALKHLFSNSVKILNAK